MLGCALLHSIAQLFVDAKRAGTLPSSCIKASLTISILEINVLRHRSLTDMFGSTVPQVLHVVHRRRAEKPLVLATEVRGVAVPYAVSSTCGIETLAEHEPARFLEPQLLLKLDGTHRGDRSKVVVEARNAHSQLARN